MRVKFEKTILKSDGMIFEYHSKSEKNPSGVILTKINSKYFVVANIDRKKNRIKYYWDVIKKFKIGTIDNLFFCADCILKNKKPNP